MNGGAANASDLSYAPLTSSLLARKGEASPAFDSDAYSEVMTGNEFTAPLSPIFTKAKNTPPSGHMAPPAPPERAADDDHHAGSSVDTHAQPKRRRVPSASQRPAPRFRAVKDGNANVSVTFRAPMEEFARLRRAAKELDMSCYQILLDALECYLDANEVEPVRNETWVNAGEDEPGV